MCVKLVDCWVLSAICTYIAFRTILNFHFFFIPKEAIRKIRVQWDRRLSRGPTRKTMTCILSVLLSILRIAMSVFIQRSSSLSSVSGTKWYEVLIVIVVDIFRLFISPGEPGVSLSLGQAEDEFQVEFHGGCGLIECEHAKPNSRTRD